MSWGARERAALRGHLGDVMSSIPMLTRFRSPPETPRTISLPTLESATLPSPNSSIT